MGAAFFSELSLKIVRFNGVMRYESAEACRVIEDVMKKAVTFYGDIKLKKEQLEVLKAVYDQGRDCVAVLPTGFGKSGIFHLIPYLTPQPKTVTCIVVAPITALMELGSTAVSE